MREPFFAAAVPQAEGVGEVHSVAEGVAAPEATPDTVSRVAQELRRVGPDLRARPTGELAKTLGRVGRRFLLEGDALRKEALELLPDTAGLAPAMAKEVLDGMARDWTPERLLAWVDREFGGGACLDGWVQESDRSVRAYGPDLCTQVVSGSVPGVGVGAILRSLMVKGPTFVKPGLGDVVLPVLFARALREEDPALGDAVAVWYWPGGERSATEAALKECDVAVVYGSDDTVGTVRSMAPPTTRVVTHHHRVGVGVVALDCLRDATASRQAAADLARAVGMFDQRGCVSPHVAFVEVGGSVGPGDFGAYLGEALSELERSLEHGPLELEEAAALQQFRGNAELRAAAGSIQLFHGGAEGSWTVTVEDAFPLAPPTFARGVRVVPFRDLPELADRLSRLAPSLQSVGYAGVAAERLPRLAEVVGQAGAARLVPFTDLAFPPPWWMHDGRHPLADLVRWVEVSTGGND